MLEVSGQDLAGLDEFIDRCGDHAPNAVREIETHGLGLECSASSRVKEAASWFPHTGQITAQSSPGH
jgi:hypothetical protein